MITNYGNVARHSLDNICHYDIGIYGDFSEGPENRCGTAWLDTKSESCKREVVSCSQDLFELGNIWELINR